MTQTLTDVELDLIFFIERFHASNGQAPTKAEINQRFTGLTQVDFDGLETNPLVQKSFHARGIVYPPAADKFTPDQMHAAAAMMDLVDRRSDEKKLRDLGISTRQWAQWQLDDDFAQYLRDRSEKLLSNSTHEIHKGLMKGVRQGNLAAVRTAYEITGRYDPTKQEQIDLRAVLHTFIEVIQKFVKDPITLHAIAMELSQVASAESYSTGLTNQMMVGAQNSQRRALQTSTVSSLPSPPPMEGFDD